MSSFEKEKDMLISITQDNYQRCFAAFRRGYLSEALEHYKDMVLQVGQHIGSMTVTYALHEDPDRLDELYFSVQPWIDQVQDLFDLYFNQPPQQPYIQNPFCTEEYGLY